MADETGIENKGMANDEANDEEDESEETLTPGDLLAFAWQVSEGMVRLLIFFNIPCLDQDLTKLTSEK